VARANLDLYSLDRGILSRAQNNQIIQRQQGLVSSSGIPKSQTFFVRPSFSVFATGGNQSTSTSAPQTFTSNFTNQATSQPTIFTTTTTTTTTTTGGTQDLTSGFDSGFTSTLDSTTTTTTRASGGGGVNDFNAYGDSREEPNRLNLPEESGVEVVLLNPRSGLTYYPTPGNNPTGISVNEGYITGEVSVDASPENPLDFNLIGNATVTRGFWVDPGIMSQSSGGGPFGQGYIGTAGGKVLAGTETTALAWQSVVSGGAGMGVRKRSTFSENLDADRLILGEPFGVELDSITVEADIFIQDIDPQFGSTSGVSCGLRGAPGEFDDDREVFPAYDIGFGISFNNETSVSLRKSVVDRQGFTDFSAPFITLASKTVNTTANVAPATWGRYAVVVDLNKVYGFFNGRLVIEADLSESIERGLYRGSCASGATAITRESVVNFDAPDFSGSRTPRPAELLLYSAVRFSALRMTTEALYSGNYVVRSLITQA
jgi:hypothetical protein